MQKLMDCIDLTCLDVGCCASYSRLVNSYLVFLLLRIYGEFLTYLDNNHTSHDFSQGCDFRCWFDIIRSMYSTIHLSLFFRLNLDLSRISFVLILNNFIDDKSSWRDLLGKWNNNQVLIFSVTLSLQTWILTLFMPILVGFELVDSYRRGDCLISRGLLGSFSIFAYNLPHLASLLVFLLSIRFSQRIEII